MKWNNRRNDCKFGYGCELSNMSLTLIKSGISPKEAYLLNQPMYSKRLNKQNGILEESMSFCQCSCDNVIIETVKLSENGDGIIIRLYEYYNMHSNATIKTGIKFKKAFICDMLENNIETVSEESNTINLSVKPFEIITLKLYLGDD